MTEAKVSRSGSWKATALALQNQFEAENVLIYQGHAFVISQGFVSYIDTLIRNGVEKIALLDSSGIPCQVDNIKEFFELLLAKHLEAMNTLSMSWAAIKNEL